ncbi:MAG TPA: amidohydrolase family protein [Pirellulales bacterium]|nr:amidohydrolase family protein [Pirellulales bacterium]
MSDVRAVRGPLLNPRRDGKVDYVADSLMLADDRGRIVDVGSWEQLSPQLGSSAENVSRSRGIIMPPMLDAHIHIPQLPVRGRFVEGIDAHPPEGRLLAGLNRNVFPAEGQCADIEIARTVIDAFAADTLAHGVVGGAAYMTVHTRATRKALERLPDTWSVGLVLMNQHCPEYLRTDEASLDADVESLARDFGRRFIVTDRFAVAVDTPLRRRAVELSCRFGLRMQTHLNEQILEKRFIEKVLYPDAHNYTDVYRRDGLLERDPILAHCVRMGGEEYDMVAATPSSIAHCPVSNTLLGSGVMPLAEVAARDIPYALCTDVGASPTTSLLCEMAQFLKMHAGRCARATPEEALFRVTLAPATILGLDRRLGTFEPGMEMSFVEIAYDSAASQRTAIPQFILHALLDIEDQQLSRYEPEQALGSAIDRLQTGGLDAGDDLFTLTDDVRRTAEQLDAKVQRVTLAGRVVWQR